MNLTTLAKVCYNLEAAIYNRYIPFAPFPEWEAILPEKQFSVYEKIEEFMNTGQYPAIPRLAKINFTKPGVINFKKAKIEAVIALSAALKVARLLIKNQNE